MAADSLGLNYTGQDGAGDAIIFGRSPNKLDHYLKMVQQAQALKKPKENPYTDDLTAAQLGRVWSPHKEHFTKRYKEYLDEVKTYERTQDQATKDQLWKKLKMTEGALVIDIGKSNKLGTQHDQLADAISKDKGFAYDDEDQRMLDELAVMPFEKTPETIGITPGTSAMAVDRVVKDAMKGFQLDEKSYKSTKADGSMESYMAKDFTPQKEKELDERIKFAIENLPAKLKNPLFNDASMKYPGFVQMTYDEKLQALADGPKLRGLNGLGKINRSATKEAPTKDAEDRATGSGADVRNGFVFALDKVSEGKYEGTLKQLNKTWRDNPTIAFDKGDGTTVNGRMKKWKWENGDIQVAVARFDDEGREIGNGAVTWVPYAPNKREFTIETGEDLYEYTNERMKNADKRFAPSVTGDAAKGKLTGSKAPAKKPTKDWSQYKRK